MGRGSSGANGSATRLTGTDGKPIDLTGTPLRYGSEDKALTGGARSAIESFKKQDTKTKSSFPASLTLTAMSLRIIVAVVDLLARH